MHSYQVMAGVTSMHSLARLVGTGQALLVLCAVLGDVLGVGLGQLLNGCLNGLQGERNSKGACSRTIYGMRNRTYAGPHSSGSWVPYAVHT